MKKWFIGFLSVVCLTTTSCDSHNIVGIENYHPSLGSMGVCDYLPTEDFLEDYTYNNANFYFLQNSTFSSWEMQKSLLWLDYEPSTYTQAKKSIIEKTPFSTQNQYNYNNYIFIESLQRVSKDALNNEGGNKNFPYKSWNEVVVADFTLFFYNDVENMLGYVSVYIPPINGSIEERAKKTGLTEFDIGEFLDYYFQDWYNFSE